MNYPDVYIAKIGSSPYAASASSYQNKSVAAQNESTATKPTGWAVSASISTVHAVLRDSRGRVRSACSGRPVLATARAMASAWAGKRCVSCAAGCDSRRMSARVASQGCHSAGWALESRFGGIHVTLGRVGVGEG